MQEHNRDRKNSLGEGEYRVCRGSAIGSAEWTVQK